MFGESGWLVVIRERFLLRAGDMRRVAFIRFRFWNFSFFSCWVVFFFGVLCLES